MFCTRDTVPYSARTEANGIFPAVYFVNTNPPEERIQILLSEKELSEIPDDSSYIFKKSNVERSSATLYKGKYIIFEDFCYREFLGCYKIENKSSKTCDYQWDELDDNLIENNHQECFYLPKIKSMISGERMSCLKARQFLQSCAK